MDTHSRSFAKALSWRVTGTIDTMIISLVVTGSIMDFDIDNDVGGHARLPARGDPQA